MRFKTPLRYPGGKGKLTDFMKLVFRENELVGGHYAEPYAGGAGVAINLLLDGFVSHIHINDLNPAVYAFWSAVLNHTDELCDLIISTPVNMEEWYIQKNVLNSMKSDGNDIVALGFAAFFLNRTNHSGILLGGVIGGKNQTGKWKLDARFNKEDLIKRIKLIAERKDDISLYNIDASKFIIDIVNVLPENSLVYLDPPYFIKGEGLYQNHYQYSDHETIAKLVSDRIRQHWIVSYDNVTQISDMYSEFRKIEYGINYSAQARYEGAEVMFFSEKIKIPNIISPLKVKKLKS